MGLLMVSYKSVETVDSSSYSEEDENIFVVDSTNHGFAVRGTHEGLVLGARYRGVDPLAYGWSYAWYNKFREELSQVLLGVGPRVVWHAPEDWVGKPGVGLIDFSDSSGVIGPVMASRLADELGASEEYVLGEWSPESVKDDHLLGAYKDFSRNYAQVLELMRHARSGCVVFQ